VREGVPGPREIPLTKDAFRVLTLAREEADAFSDKYVCTAHLLLGLLREQESLAAQVLSERNVHLVPTRNQLLQTPHDDSALQRFVLKDRPLPNDVIEAKARIESIGVLMEEAIAESDFEKARTLSEEQGKEGYDLFLLYRKHGLDNWLYD
jgi:ATP-dependent Clp protease ATP-binding subunit ClpA